MGAPEISIDVQPIEGGKAFYLPIAAKAAGEPEMVKIVLRLVITNNYRDRVVKLSSIKFSFPGSSVPTATMQGVKIAMDPEDSDGEIQPGKTAIWSNGRVDLDTTEAGEDWVRNEVYLDAPAPPKVKVSVACEGFSDPVTVTLDLIPYINPTGTGSLRLPFSAYDLDRGEYIVTSAQHGTNGGANGTQIFAHDIGVQGRVNGTWTSLLPGKDKTRNEHYRIWGIPVRALAAGTVISWENDIDDNPSPGEKIEGAPKAGNHVWVRHGDIKVKYAHFQKGSVSDEVMVQGAAVRSGQRLGLAGNSGNSSGPHLHLEGRDFATNTLRGLPFRNGSVLERDKIQADQSGPWVRLTADGICKDKVAIRPLGLQAVGRVSPEIVEIVAEVFGGVTQGGGGFVIVGGKIIKVPPRGPKSALLEALIALDEVDQIDARTAARLEDITGNLAEIVKDAGKPR
jgi:hypothetical protein